MVKTLVLVRHGVSERGSEDMSRELTRAGQRALSANYPHIFGLLGPEGKRLRFGQVLLFVRLRLQRLWQRRWILRV